ncbi:hypothetical protein PC129_g19492 [Phytophthora cactorum]|uniref:MARVEL domain-containing protein n=2 Tax=Phytophthora TaxID=4783 RepID=A0A329T159_9STRA|nr:hypothetical protein GQ600_19294 [Phytophthora cactorum]KAG6951589.1 hypothetical protein JG688_00013670 [Phytophthora aleatoria]KAF1785001.1 hypothetical protein GQ600_20775 [Phytophthora cactorum]KAG2765507.1 hypothetical protein Pcac1_g23084 [Phytophthora cactorum]KAG2800750.1 hypothetical protein PC111_g19842 [Phytophthora cactorum]
MVHERVPMAVRLLTIFLAIIATGTAGSGGIKSCDYGQEMFRSGTQVYFLITIGALVVIMFTVRVLVFDVRKLRLPKLRAFVIFDSVWLMFTFASAVAVAAAPVGTSVCSGVDKDIMILLEEVCEFHCSNIVTAIIAMFLTSVCIVFDILFTTGAIPVGSSEPPAEDFTFGETAGSPRSQKANANRGSAEV